MGQLRLVVKIVNLSTVLGKGGEWDNVVEIDLKSRVNVFDKSFDILFGSSVEWYDNQLGPLGSDLVEDLFVVVDRCSAVSRCCDDTDCSTRQETLEDLYTDTALSNTGKEGGFLGESDTRGSDLGQDVEVYL
jgi:hypothetical protein